ncbi:MAG: hypothetical protein Q8K22_12340 [Rhodoferax sp.]|nr:hypothetical protein [Rhodoferax sp.]
MGASITDYRNQAAVNMYRYRVAGGSRCVVAEGVAMVTGPGLMVAGLLIVSGLLIVKKTY